MGSSWVQLGPMMVACDAPGGAGLQPAAADKPRVHATAVWQRRLGLHLRRQPAYVFCVVTLAHIEKERERERGAPGMADGAREPLPCVAGRRMVGAIGLAVPVALTQNSAHRWTSARCRLSWLCVPPAPPLQRCGVVGPVFTSCVRCACVPVTGMRLAHTSSRCAK